MFKQILFIVLAVFSISCSDSQAQNESEKLSADDFSKKIKSSDNMQIVDVRTPGEFKSGHIENALNIDWNGNDFYKLAAALDKSKPVYVYCLSGGRSSSAASALRQSGFEKVYEIPGGMMEWRANGLPEKTTKAIAHQMTMEQYNALFDSDKPVLINFHAEWCAPCKKMKPYLEKMIQELADKVIIMRIDADAHPRLCKELGITGLPALKLYQSKNLIWEHNGFIEEQDLRAQINK